MERLRGQETVDHIPFSVYWKMIGGDRYDRNKTVIRHAFRYAVNTYRGQYRGGGERFVTHPIAVSLLLRSFDDDLIVSSLLHDVVKNSDTPINEIRSMLRLYSIRFDTITDLIFGMTDAYPHQSSLERLHTVAKRDVRVFILKLADSYHNIIDQNNAGREVSDMVREEIRMLLQEAKRYGIESFSHEIQSLLF